jgi:hypothetical protein
VPGQLTWLLFKQYEFEIMAEQFRKMVSSWFQDNCPSKCPCDLGPKKKLMVAI